MKKAIVSIFLSCFILVACASQSPIPLPTAVSSPTHISVDLTPAELAAIDALSSTSNLPPEQIALVSSEAVTWPNGCLGVQKLGIMCTQNQVPGFRIVLQARGTQYEFHTNQDGTVIVPAEGMQASGPAQEAAIKQLAANLGLQSSDVQLLSSSDVEWPDSCLGVPLEGVMCAQVVTPGYLIVLQALGHSFEYHTNTDGSNIMPATLGMAWREEGGIAGLCKSLTVYRSGEVYGLNCRSESDGRMGILINLLSADERQNFYQWLDTYSNTVVDLSDPANVSDRMTRNLDFYGTGSE
ncbi:MAG TPA: hypothetical protein VHM28_10735, partial [Anaerolineales bacterium]|nr:hypothetical protein [Anaerolineales bacterium]